MKRVSKSQMQTLVARHMRFEDGEAVARFKRFVVHGIEPWLAAIHATGNMPGVVGTDTQFMAGSEKQFDKCPMLGDMTRKHKEGYTKGARFHAGIGQWVSNQGDIVRWAKKLNKTVTTPEGKVLHQGHYEPTQSVALAEDSIRDHMRRYAAKDPSLVSTPKKRARLREDVLRAHAPANKLRHAK